MIIDWKDLHYWQTGEWQVVEEKLDDLKKARTLFNPDRKNLFRSLKETPYADCRVAIYGQDPYPNHQHATGIALSIPDSIKVFPPTLTEVYREYQRDLSLEPPTVGNLTPWAKQGVLLWNVIPSCTAGHSLSHDWTEYTYLTKEITEELSAKGIVFVFLGMKARQYKQFVDQDKNFVIETSHPSPRGSLSSKVPFVGSRLFSRINDYLVQQKKTPIEWRLP